MPKLSTHHYGAPEITFQRAKSLRKKMTKVEKMLWHELRANKLRGYHFRRQHPLGYFIADFYCHELKLVIEVDGPTHETAEGKKKDALRDKIMKSEGITILRFTAEEVYNELDKVMLRIEALCP